MQANIAGLVEPSVRDTKLQCTINVVRMMLEYYDADDGTILLAT